MQLASPTSIPEAQFFHARIDWLTAASVVPGKGLHLALLLHTLCSIRAYPAVRLTRQMLAQGYAMAYSERR